MQSNVRRWRLEIYLTAFGWEAHLQQFSSSEYLFVSCIIINVRSKNAFWQKCTRFQFQGRILQILKKQFFLSETLLIATLSTVLLSSTWECLKSAEFNSWLPHEHCLHEAHSWQYHCQCCTSTRFVEEKVRCFQSISQPMRMHGECRQRGN